MWVAPPRTLGVAPECDVDELGGVEGVGKDQLHLSADMLTSKNFRAEAKYSNSVPQATFANSQNKPESPPEQIC